MDDPTTELGDLGAVPDIRAKPLPGWTKTLIFAFEIAFVAGLLVWWLTSRSLRESKSLWVLFLYCFPAEFIISTVPHEPVLFYFAKFYSPLTVALISVTGTVITEVLNYTVFKYVADLKVFRKMLESRAVQKTVNLFKKAPFAALWVAGFTPIPFYPFRFLVVLARYPIVMYILAVITSRGPRMYLLALAARAIRFPDYTLVILMAVLIVAANLPILRKVLKREKAIGEPDRSSNTGGPGTPF
jgi:membrane protein YqaA with SNARE-associated domain